MNALEKCVCHFNMGYIRKVFHDETQFFLFFRVLDSFLFAGFCSMMLERGECSVGKKIVVLLFCLVILCPSASAYWVLEDEIVYVTKSGECFHQESCGYIDLETAEGIPYNQAISSGYRGCSWCIEDQTEAWDPYGDFLWYNSFLDQWRDEEGYLYNDPSEAYSSLGYYPSDDGYMWFGDNGYLVDGEYYPYPEDTPDYCGECENVIEDKYSDHSEDCPNNPANKEAEIVNAEPKEEKQAGNEETTADKLSQFMEEQSLYAFLGLFGIPVAIILYNKVMKKIFKI
ncbi:MAG: hypothetical protein ACI3VS_06265 [Evtepia sp.]